MDNTTTPKDHLYELRNLTSTRACLWTPRALAVDDLPFMMLQIQLLLVFFITQCLHRVFTLIGLPRLSSQLVAGILISPEIVGLNGALRSTYELIFPDASDEVWECIGLLGYALSIFIIAVQTDFSIIKRCGVKTIVFGLMGVFIPIVSNFLVRTHIPFTKNPDAERDLNSVSLSIGMISFPVVQVLLSELKILNTELGRLALSTSIIADSINVLITVLSKNLAMSAVRDQGLQHAGYRLGLFLFLIGFVIFLMLILFRPYLHHVIENTPKGRPVGRGYVMFVFVVMLLGAMLTDFAGEFVVLGCFLVGAATPDGQPLGSAIVDKFEFLVMDLFLPFFITTCVMKSNVLNLRFFTELQKGLMYISLSNFSTRILACVVCGLLFRMRLLDSVALGFILSSKGMVDVGYVTTLYGSKLITDMTFGFMVALITVLSVVVPIAVMLLYHPLRKYNGYEVKDIMHWQKHEELRILVCISRLDNVSSVTSLLSQASPSPLNPVHIDVLHLMKLIGRAQSVFISHDSDHAHATNIDYSDNVIWAFHGFQHDHIHSFAMHFYTAVSPQRAMHTDICTLALDKKASLIILPFHLKHKSDGTIGLEDYNQRVINYRVLKTAPCSVGILIDRGISKGSVYNTTSTTRQKSGRITTLASILAQQPEEEELFRVGVIFIRGKDDQEAASYAKQMANGCSVRVHLIRLVSSSDDEEELSMMDQIALSGFSKGDNSDDAQFVCTEEMVESGADTAKLLRSIAGDYDLIIVGRRYDDDCPQTSNLRQWCEVPEIGILGDLLASPDMPFETSVLVVQRQNNWTWTDLAKKKSMFFC